MLIRTSLLLLAVLLVSAAPVAAVAHDDLARATPGFVMQGQARESMASSNVRILVGALKGSRRGYSVALRAKGAVITRPRIDLYRLNIKPGRRTRKVFIDKHEIAGTLGASVRHFDVRLPQGLMPGRYRLAARGDGHATFREFVVR